MNVRGTWLVTRALAPLFADGKHGRIVNIASDTALWGRRGSSPMWRARAR